ncbi:hypothetical protein WSK_2914 [Novosphingobium sp. Rr 2-17]|uniref:Rap1a/Tai family immunity protein n=1 Tax=Novosphingobium sp. Rr 2-17 TaxID=555793 RepID=UPI000269A1FE|nr:Rap1a/Tai family immunity protein [Novosphingobium sp. Rr 2-17]EIZ78470.1 hypothetical protein WSK_2914 [Novosphingobium sp. Rr 2-17]
MVLALAPHGAMAAPESNERGPNEQKAPAPATSAAPDGSIGFLTASQLSGQCRQSSAFAVTYCFAYLAGVHDTIRAYEQWLKHKEFCAPATIKQQDLSDVFASYVAAHPEFAEGQASSVALVALKEAWPCKRP